MSKTAFAFLGLYGLAMAAAFVFPPAGVWGFLFESNFSPSPRWWGRPLMDLGQRWSFYIGVAMGLGVLLNWDRYSSVPLMKHWQTTLIILFTVNAFLVTQWAYDYDTSWRDAMQYLNWLLVYICIIKTHSDRKWLPVILFIYIFFCVKAGWDTTFDPPRDREVFGGPTTAFQGNSLSGHAAALLPLVGVYAVSPILKWRYRIACLVGAPLLLNIVAYGESRAAFLALGCGGVMTLLAAKGRLRRMVIVGLLLGVLAGARLFHEQFWWRMKTIQTYEEDTSATARIGAWKDAWRLAQENPFGYGSEAFDLGLRSQPNSTHNMFFEILVAWGWQGVLLFFGMISLTMRDCWKLRNALWRPGEKTQSREWLDSVGILAVLVTMLVIAVFMNRVRWELWWVLPAYVGCIKNILALESPRVTVPLGITRPVYCGSLYEQQPA